LKVKILYKPKTSRINKIDGKLIDLSIHEVYLSETAPYIYRPEVDKKLIKGIYLNKIHESLQGLFENGRDIKELISYQTFSKLSVADFLIDRFWVIYEYNKLIQSNGQAAYVIIDDKLCYNVLRNQNEYNIFPIKPFYYFFSLLKKKLNFRIKNIPRIHKSTFLFIGHQYESTIEIGNYSDYFFKNSWQNSAEETQLLLRKKKTFHKSTSNRISLAEDRLPIIDIIRTFVISIKNFYFPVKVLQKDIYDFLLNKNLKSDSSNGSFFENLIWASIMSKGFSQIEWDKIKQVVFPFEGRAYEKQVIHYLHSINFKGSVIGYAHFPLSEKILNYYTGPFENTFCDKLKIITIGRNNREIISRSGWCENRFQNEFYVKRINIPKVYVSSNSKAKVGLILLGNGKVQSKKMLSIIIQSGMTKQYKFNVRAHPALELKNVIDFNKTKNVDVCKEESLSQAIINADFIFYGDTGAAIDALPFNKPMYYIMDDNIFCSDRIVDNQELHRRFNSIQELENFFLSRQIEKDIKDAISIDRNNSLSNYFSSNLVSWI